MGRNVTVWRISSGTLSYKERISYFGASQERNLPAIVSQFPRKIRPDILIFDVDGVLVDVRDTYWRSAIETILRLTGKRVTHAELNHWKGQPGNNDDWQMVANWATALGRPTSYAEARDAFGEFYWGTDLKPGNVSREKIIVTAAQIARWAARVELNLFTGRNRREFKYTLSKRPGPTYFQQMTP